MHAAPLLPQLALAGVRHVVPSQQPEPHELASQTQLPDAQRCPTAQGAPEPHAHTPEGEHPSARTESQRTHATPVRPQLATLGALHVEPEQQPLAQIDVHSGHVPPVHVPAAHVWQAPPPLPHWAADVPSWHTSPTQHPLQEMPSHTQLPATQRWPAAHEAPPPQLQRPLVHPSDALGSHEAQAPPIAPQLVAAIAAHTSPSQQPDVQEVASQAQRPELQCWPGRHAGPIPHPHAPLAEHASLSEGSHATQLAPATPQVVMARRRHVAPSQHPEGHDVASQTQSPTTQRCPALHADASPHAQAPSMPHPSARSASQARQAEPSAPHAVGERGKQDAPEQHPSAQLAALQPEQTPAAHICPVGHAEHARPALPHAALSLPGRHTLPAQQPDAHETASQTHVPALHLCPAAQLGPAPQPCVQRE